jgi:hypothetical protein
MHRMKRDSGFQDFRPPRTIKDRRYEIRQTFILHTMWSVGASLPETGCCPIMHVYLLPSAHCYANSSGERKCLPSVLRFMNMDFVGNAFASNTSRARQYGVARCDRYCRDITVLNGNTYEFNSRRAIRNGGNQNFVAP